jgi:hypothetical protein
MKVIIAGSRTIKDYSVVKSAIEQSGWLNEITIIVSGCAKGVDTIALEYADDFDITPAKFHADWEKHGKSAGYIRNVEMAHYGNKLIAIQKEESPGTAHMIRTMARLNKPIFLIRYNHF